MKTVMKHLLAVLCLVGTSSGVITGYDRHMACAQPISLRAFKYLDFISAFDAVYMHAVALNEVDALPDGFVRAWEAIKSGYEVIDFKDLLQALPVLYDQLLLIRSCAVPDESGDRVEQLEQRIIEIERVLLQVMFDFEQRLNQLENPS